MSLPGHSFHPAQEIPAGSALTPSPLCRSPRPSMEPNPASPADDQPGQLDIVTVVLPPLPLLPGIHGEVHREQLVLRVCQGDHSCPGTEMSRLESKRTNTPHLEPALSTHRSIISSDGNGLTENPSDRQHSGSIVRAPRNDPHSKESLHNTPSSSALCQWGAIPLLLPLQALVPGLSPAAGAPLGTGRAPRSGHSWFSGLTVHVDRSWPAFPPSTPEFSSSVLCSPESYHPP